MSQTSGDQFSLRGAVDLSGLGRPAAAASGPQGDASPAGGYVVDVTEETFQQVVEQSADHVVIVLLWLPQDPSCMQLAADLATLSEEQEGRFQLARVDAEKHPAIAQAFQAEGVPMAIAVLRGQPLPLFQGVAEMAQLRGVVDQVLAAAEQNGVTGRVSRGDDPQEHDGSESAEPEEPAVPAHLLPAQEALEAGDFAAAATAYREALRNDPRDTDATSGLARVELLERTQSVDLAQVRAAGAEQPDDVPAQLAVADVDLVGGKVDDAFARLLDLFVRVEGDQRDQVRTRLLDYFAVLGTQDPRVAPARRRLTSLLY